MKPACNIDQTGRRVRLIGGIIVDTIGTGLIIAGFLVGSKAMLIGGAFTSVGGTFMIIEGAIGWCAMRAMGFKTRF